MAGFQDDVEPIAEGAAASSSLGKRPRASAEGERADEHADDHEARMSRLSPEPDEDLDTTDARHQVWLVKVPKFLMQAWSSIQQDDLRLGTVRVFDPDHTGHQRMELLLPQPPQPAVPSDGAPNKTAQWNKIPRNYDLKLTSDSVNTVRRNLYAFKEKFEEEAPGKTDDPAEARRRRGKGRRTTALCGTITNEASLQPQIRAPLGGAERKAGSVSFMSGPGISDEYRELLRKRREEASKPKRTIKMLDQSDAGRANMLVAGVGTAAAGSRSRFNQTIAAKPSKGAASAPTEKFARMPRNELLDLLFAAFEKWQFWSIKKLRAETQQPESYLREVLASIADLHKRGPYVGNYSLKPEFVEGRLGKRGEQRGGGERER
ncbi:hypothetical protein ACQY0O_006969 [Thecaphora frezii]